MDSTQQTEPKTKNDTELDDLIINAEFKETNGTAPITAPEQIRDENTRNKVIALVQTNNGGTPADLEQYELSPLPKTNDPRSTYQKVMDYISMALPNKKALVLRRIEQDKVIAQAQVQAQWLKDSVEGIKAWSERARTAYERTVAYKTSREAGIKGMKMILVAGEEYIKNAPQLKRDLEERLNSVTWQQKLEQQLGDPDAALAVRKSVEEELQQTGHQYGNTKRTNAYLNTLIDYFSGVVRVANTTIKEMEAALEKAAQQQLDLAVKLDTYQGLTANQIDFALATRFLRDVGRVTAQLGQSMDRVDDGFNTETSSYNASPHGYEVAPTPTDLQEIEIIDKKCLAQDVKQ